MALGSRRILPTRARKTRTRPRTDTATTVIRSATAALSLVAAFALAAAACGGDDGDRSSASARDDEERPPATGRLTPRQYTALEDVYEAALPIDELEPPEEPASQSELEAIAKPVVAACETLDGDDRLLRELRAACLAAMRLLVSSAGVSNCGAAHSCRQAIEGMRAAARDVVASSRASDRVIAAARLAPGCTRALATPEAAYTYYRRLDAHLAKLAEALASGSAAQVRAAAAALARLDADAPSARQSLGDFRAACR